MHDDDNTAGEHAGEYHQKSAICELATHNARNCRPADSFVDGIVMLPGMRARTKVPINDEIVHLGTRPELSGLGTNQELDQSNVPSHEVIQVKSRRSDSVSKPGWRKRLCPPNAPLVLTRTSCSAR